MWTEWTKWTQWTAPTKGGIALTETKQSQLPGSDEWRIESQVLSAILTKWGFCSQEVVT